MAVLATILIPKGETAAGALAKVIAFGVGGVVSTAGVVADAPDEGAVAFWPDERSRAVTV